MASGRNRQTVSLEELAYSTMSQVQALVELLEERGLLTQREVLERVGNNFRFRRRQGGSNDYYGVGPY